MIVLRTEILIFFSGKNSAFGDWVEILFSNFREIFVAISEKWAHAVVTRQFEEKGYRIYDMR